MNKYYAKFEIVRPSKLEDFENRDLWLWRKSHLNPKAGATVAEASTLRRKKKITWTMKKKIFQIVKYKSAIHFFFHRVTPPAHFLLRYLAPGWLRDPRNLVLKTGLPQSVPDWAFLAFLIAPKQPLLLPLSWKDGVLFPTERCRFWFGSQDSRIGPPSW